MGEYVRSASSTVEPPVVRRLKEEYGERLQTLGEAKKKPAKKAPKSGGAPTAAAKDAPEAEAAPAVDDVVAPESGKATSPVPGPKPAKQDEAAPEPQIAEAPAEAHSAGVAPTTEHDPEPPAAPPAPRPVTPGPHPSAPRPPSVRPGNNPFSSKQGMQRPARPGAVPAAAREGAASSRPGMPRPNPAMMPKQSSPALGAGRGPGRGPGGPGGRPGGGAGGGGFGGRPGGPRGNNRGGTQGAFGRAGGPVRRGRKSKRAKRQEYDQMQAPAIGGVRVRKGNGETIRVTRGSSLGDFAEKIGVDAASLVEVLFHLGEVVTATQSANDETLQLLGEELNYSVEVISPEEEDRELLESFDLEFGENEGCLLYTSDAADDLTRVD